MYASIERVVEFRDAGGKLCGSYHYDDPYKSFFRGLYTPNGHDVVALPPRNHPHHKGLQYGLCAEDVNFWEEKDDSRRVGRQQTEKLDLFSGSDGIGFSQELIWQDDVCVSFHETRTISVQTRTPTAYVWTWQTTLTAARDLQLIKSAWVQGPSQIGYCGLGLRLARGLFQKSTLSPNAPSGSTPGSVAFRGTGAEVKFEQDTQMQKNVLYVSFYSENSEDFAFMSSDRSTAAPTRCPSRRESASRAATSSR